MKQPWNPVCFARMAETYGSDLARWPQALQESAAAYVTANPAARSLLAQETAMDAQLDSFTVAAPDAYYLARLHALPTARTAEILTPLFAVSNRWASGMALAASLVFGFLLGISRVDNTSNSAELYLHHMVFGASPVQEMVL